MYTDDEKLKRVNTTVSSQSNASIRQTEIIHLQDGDPDVAAKYAAQLGPAYELDPAMSKRLVRKADMYICSIMCLVYAMQYMDKVASSGAAIMGLRTDLKMDGQMYSWVGSSFYLGYLIFELPMNFLLQKLPLAKTTGVVIVIWGIDMAASGAAKTYPGFMTARVALGILEGAITPSFMVLTSQWYKRNEQFTRTCIWFGFNGLGGILASGIAYGLAMNNSLPMKDWRLLFIIMGIITVVLGIFFAFWVPDTPATAWFLTEEEKAAQVERIRENKIGYGNKHIKWYQVREAFIDPRTYLYFAITLLNNVPNGGLTNFQAILLQSMGYKGFDSLKIGMAPSAIELGGTFLTGVAAMYFLNHFRMAYACACGLFTVLALCLLAWGPNNAAQFASLCIYIWSSPVSYISLLSNVSSNTAGRTKKSIVSTALLMGYCVGNLIGPQTFKANEEPEYPTAKVSMAACGAAYAFLLFVLTFLNYFENKRRDRANKKLPPDVVNSEFADLTDFENPEFRYAL